MSHEIPITLNFDLDLQVSYEVEGRYYPQTLETPAEYPELLILSAIIEGTTFDLSSAFELARHRDPKRICCRVLER